MSVRSTVTNKVTRSVTALLILGLIGAGCSSGGDDEQPKAKPSATPAGPVEIDFAVYGPEPVIAAYKEIAARFTLENPGTKVVVKPYPDHDRAMAAVRQGTADGDPPDVFLTDRDDLAALAEDKAVRRLDDLLAAREVDFGDGYTRNGLEAFSLDSALQCMPSDVSPLVVYFNPKLIELDQIAEPGRNPVDQEAGWSLEEFGRAALQPRSPGVRGLYVAPTLEQVAPFIWSGGGEVVDDQQDPTTLTLAEGASASATEKLLELVRDPALTFGQNALERRSALERFKAGKLGMLLGFRDLTPELRAKQDLSFDVMPLPRIGSRATIATMSGVCISSGSKHTSEAADFLTSVISDEGAGTLAKTGYVMPANLDVLNSDEFLQSGQRPLNASVFSKEVRDTRLLPSTPTWPEVSKNASQELTKLFYEPVILSLEESLKAIDEASVPVLDPEAGDTGGSPSPAPTATPGDDSTP